MSSKKLSQPVWWKNTYFAIAAILLILAIIGLAWGDHAVRDPGQKREGLLWLLYLGAAVIMFINGWLSHRQTVQHYEEQVGSTTDKGEKS